MSSIQWERTPGPWLAWNRLKSRSIKTRSKALASNRFPKVSRSPSPNHAVPKSIVRGKYTIINSGLLTQILCQESLFGPKGNDRFPRIGRGRAGRRSNNASPTKEMMSPTPERRKIEVAKSGVTRRIPPIEEKVLEKRKLRRYDRAQSTFSCDFTTEKAKKDEKQKTFDISQWSGGEDSESEH